MTDLTKSPDLEQLAQIASKPPATVESSIDETLIQQSVNYLLSDEAATSLSCDPYWPKWNSPWWHLLLLHEINAQASIPPSSLATIVRAIDTHYLKEFPFSEAEVPAGMDPLSHIACHCQLGTMHNLLNVAGIDVNASLPWLSNWYQRYQMPDGGFNCDEAAYTRPQPKSSMVSTLPPLEAVLANTNSPFTDGQINLLDRGASYLIKRRLSRAAQTGNIINNEWLSFAFPRFYHYDVLRGLSFLLGWATRLNRALPLTAIGETVEHIDNQFPDGIIKIQRSIWVGTTSRVRHPATNSWSKVQALGFPLLEAVSKPQTTSSHLTSEWNRAKSSLSALLTHNLIRR